MLKQIKDVFNEVQFEAIRLALMDRQTKCLARMKRNRRNERNRHYWQREFDQAVQTEKLFQKEE